MRVPQITWIGGMIVERMSLGLTLLSTKIYDLSLIFSPRTGVNKSQTFGFLNWNLSLASRETM